MNVMTRQYRGRREYDWVRTLLVGAARQHQTISYIPIARILGLEDSGNHMGKQVGQICGEISEDEHDHGHPMLSAVAVNSGNSPGPGFFDLVRAVGRLNGDQSDDQFWRQERDAVFNHWAG